MYKIIFYLSLILVAQTAAADTQFIKYRNYLIPINVAPDVACQFREIPSNAQVVDQGNARVVLLSDLAGADNRGLFDPDDIQSLVHILTFADQLDIEGIIPSATRSRNLYVVRAFWTAKTLT